MNINVDEMLLSEKKKGIGVDSFTVISLSCSCKGVLISDSYLAK